MINLPPYLANDPFAGSLFPAIVQRVIDTRHPFYAARLMGNPINVPLLTRTQILDRNDIFLNGHKETARTSGSTGIPVRVSWSPERQAYENKANQEVLKWAGGTTKAMIIIHRAPDAPNVEYIMDVRTPADEQIAAIRKLVRRRGADGVTTYPTNAEQLARYILDHKLDMRSIKVVGLYAEAFEPHQEELIRAAFPNAHIWSGYSCMEVGVIAMRCPKAPGFHHIFPTKNGVEILNDKDEPAQIGELGRIVVTDYYNDWSPFLRYDIGDLAEPAICDCGNTRMPAITNLAGKIRGALVHRDGHRVPFHALSVAIRDIPGVRQYQVIQHELEKFELRIVRDPAKLNGESFEATVREKFHDEFGYHPEIAFTPEEQIERGANGKFYASISKV